MEQTQMDWSLLFTGLFLILVGSAIFSFPHDVRNFVPAREWQTNPERA